MPCHPAKARILLKEGKAKVVNSKTGHFTIQLLHGSSGYKQEVELGLDPGAKVTPLAAIANNEIVYAKEIILRQDISRQLTGRARHRRGRRNRLRYREPRFDNRVKRKCSSCGVNNVPRRHRKRDLRSLPKSQRAKKKGRMELCRPCQRKKVKGQHAQNHVLPPSVKRRADTALMDIKRLMRVLPITKIRVEIAEFDTQKMSNIDIEGVEYQQGTLQGEELRSYIFMVHQYKCAYCGGLSGDVRLEVEHIYPRSKGGSNKLSNLTCACITCNKEKDSKTLSSWKRILEESPTKLNKKRLSNIPKIKKQGQLKSGFQYSSLTQSYNNYLLSELRKMPFEIEITRGFKTKYDRKQLGLEKSQVIDSMVIASGGRPFKMPSQYLIEKHLKTRHPYHYISPCKSGTPIIKRPFNVEEKGFRLWDKVSCYHKKLGHTVGYISGRRKSGSFSIKTIDGDNLFSKTYKKLNLHEKRVSNKVREIRRLDSLGNKIARTEYQLELFKA